MATRKWSELSTPARAGIVVLSAVELVLTTVAVVDLVRRPADRVRGPKAAWVLACAVQPFGPVAYLTLGRRTD